MSERKINGRKAEDVSAAWLREKGMEILCQNYRCRFGEIDLIGRDDGYLVFVEVKARRSETCGYPGEALTIQKKKRICQTARFYCFEKRIPEEQPIRFDVVEILGKRIRYTKNAFDYI